MLKLGGSREVKISWLSPKFNGSLNHGISWTKGVFDVWSQQTEETEETEGYFTTFWQEQTSRFRVLDIGSMYGIFTYIYHHILWYVQGNIPYMEHTGRPEFICDLLRFHFRISRWMQGFWRLFSCSTWLIVVFGQYHEAVTRYPETNNFNPRKRYL